MLHHFWFSYQFLEDAYKNHRQHMENMTRQLQEKKKLIEEVSNSISSGYVYAHSHDSIGQSTECKQKFKTL